MTDPIQHFIATAVAPLADPAIRAAAETELRTRIDAFGAGTEANLSEMTAALEAADRRPSLKHWRKVLVALMLLVCVPLLLLTAFDVIRFGLGFKFMRGELDQRLPSGWTRAFLKDASPRAPLVLTGDASAGNDADRWRPLWDSEPDNPAFLAQYAGACFSVRRQLPPEVTAAAQRIDPDNGWFPLMAAAGLAKEAVEKGKLSRADAKAGKAAPLKVRDEAKLREALALIHEAAGKPRFESYEAALQRQRMALLVEPTDYLSTMAHFAHVAGASNHAYQFGAVADALAAGARASAEQRDAAAFARLDADWQWLYQTTLTEADSLIGVLIGKALATGPIRHFRDAAIALGLGERAAALTRIEEALRRERQAKEDHPPDHPNNDLIFQRGSVFGRLALPTATRLVKEPPVLTEDDLRPGRLADHALLDRLLTVVAWVLFAGCSAILLLSRLSNRQLAPLTNRMVLLFRASDWCWIVLGGVLLPLAWFVAITRFTPLSAREWSPAFTAFIQPCVQHAALRLLVCLLPVTLARWRLGRRGAALGLAGTWLWVDGLCLGLAALAVPLAGAVFATRSETLLVWATLVLLARLQLLDGFWGPDRWIFVHFLKRSPPQAWDLRFQAGVVRAG